MYLFAALDSMIESKMGKVENGSCGSWFCLECHYESSIKGDVKNHIEAKHIEAAATSCDLCGVVTKTRKAMKMHKHRQHKPLPPNLF